MCAPHPGCDILSPDGPAGGRSPLHSALPRVSAHGMIVPTVTTQRFTLRPLRRSDAAALWDAYLYGLLASDA